MMPFLTRYASAVSDVDAACATGVPSQGGCGDPKPTPQTKITRVDRETTDDR